MYPKEQLKHATTLSAETIERLKAWERLGRAEVFAPVLPASADDEHRTIDIVWFTGIDVERFSFIEGQYTLRFDPKGADLSVLNSGAPILDNHWDNSLDDQRGVVLSAWQESNRYLATIRMQRSTEMTGRRPKADALWQDIKDKIVSKFSMGVEILNTEDQRDKDRKLILRTAKKWRPFEISIAPVPADHNTSTLSAIRASASVASLAFHQRSREIELLRLR